MTLFSLIALPLLAFETQRAVLRVSDSGNAGCGCDYCDHEWQVLCLHQNSKGRSYLTPNKTKLTGPPAPAIAK
jgi:hypothetical protein